MNIIEWFKNLFDKKEKQSPFSVQSYGDIEPVFVHEKTRTFVFESPPTTSLSSEYRKNKVIDKEEKNEDDFIIPIIVPGLILNSDENNSNPETIESGGGDFGGGGSSSSWEGLVLLGRNLVQMMIVLLIHFQFQMIFSYLYDLFTTRVYQSVVR